MPNLKLSNLFSGVLRQVATPGNHGKYCAIVALGRGWRSHLPPNASGNVIFHGGHL